jgi:hypothetical protein
VGNVGDHGMVDYEIARERIPAVVAESMTPRILGALASELSRNPTGPVFAILLRDAIAMTIKIALNVEAVNRPSDKRPSTN